MSTQSAAHPTSLQNPAVPVTAQLAAAWTSFMFLYIYVDYLTLYKPGVVDDILDGVVWEFEITQTFAASALASVAVPILMIVLSATLPARVNRVLNLVVAVLYIPYSAFNLVGEQWLVYYGLGLGLELVLLGFIIRAAWAWPRTTSVPSTGGASTRRAQVTT